MAPEPPPPSRVELVEAGNGRRSVVELTTPVADNPLYRAFVALRSLGVQIVHAEVRKAKDSVTQRLHLVENDGSALGLDRLSDVIATLSRAQWASLKKARPVAVELSGAA